LIARRSRQDETAAAAGGIRKPHFDVRAVLDVHRHHTVLPQRHESVLEDVPDERIHRRPRDQCAILVRAVLATASAAPIVAQWN
jgi:hypothetical protein